MSNNKVTIRDVYELIEDFRKEITESYVTQKEFRPVRTVVYGMVGLILSSVAVAICAKVIIAFGL